MAIKILITLEGSEQIKSALESMTQSGEAFMKNMGGIGDTISQPLQGLSDNFSKAKPAIDDARQATRGFHELLLVMNPILRTAGVELSAFAGFSRLASVGIGGLAVAIGTGIIVALSKLADSTAVAQKRLETLLNIKPGTGGEAMARLQGDAAKLGSTASTVQPIIEKFVGALRQANAATGAIWMAPPGQSLPAILAKDFEQASPAATALFEAIRLGGATQAQASQEAQKFADALKNAGKVNGDVVRTLNPLGGAIKTVGEALGLGGLNAEQLANRLDKTPKSIEELYKGLVRLKPEIDKTFDDSPVVKFDDALGRVSTSWGNLWKEFSSSEFAVGFLDVIARMPEDFMAAIDAIKKDWNDFREWISKIKLIDFTPEAQLFGKAPGQLAKDLGVADIKTNLDEIQLEGGKTALDFSTAWGDAVDGFKFSFESATGAVILNFDQIQKKADETAKKIQAAINPFLAPSPPPKWVSPTGTVEGPTAPSAMLTPAAPPAQTTQTVVAPFQEADNQIRTIWLELTQWIADSLKEVDLTALTGALVAPFAAAVPLIRDELAKVEAMIDIIMRELAAALGAVQQLNQGGKPSGGGPGFIEIASGGYIRGPGTATSDSIPAWLSNREYVIQARAVDHYGPNLFAALNSMRLPKDLFSHFSIGGLANALARTMPRYATGGLAAASAGRSLTIVLDGQRFGLNGSADVVDQFERVATRVGIAQIGRPPGWVR